MATQVHHSGPDTYRIPDAESGFFKKKNCKTEFEIEFVLAREQTQGSRGETAVGQ